MLAVHGTDFPAAHLRLRRLGLETRCRLVVLEHYNAFPVDSQGISLARDITAMAEAGANLLKKRLADASRPRERVFAKAGTQRFK